jgi:hypothetical protein
MLFTETTQVTVTVIRSLELTPDAKGPMSVSRLRRARRRASTYAYPTAMLLLSALQAYLTYQGLVH